MKRKKTKALKIRDLSDVTVSPEELDRRLRTWGEMHRLAASLKGIGREGGERVEPRKEVASEPPTAPPKT
jgi:hypothetical protein